MLLKKLGYRFILRKFEHPIEANKGEEVTFKITVENKGVAPFYFNWPLVIYFMDQDDQEIFTHTTSIDIRNWLPGERIDQETITIPTSLAAAEYNIKLAILDLDTNKPAIRFANTNRDIQGRYLVSKIKIN
jgi:hypothetical protein